MQISFRGRVYGIFHFTPRLMIGHRRERRIWIRLVLRTFHMYLISLILYYDIILLNVELNHIYIFKANASSASFNLPDFNKSSNAKSHSPTEYEYVETFPLSVLSTCLKFSYLLNYTGSSGFVTSQTQWEKLKGVNKSPYTAHWKFWLISVRFRINS